MSIFYQQDPPIPSKRCNCKCLASALKDAFAKCHSFRLKIPDSVPEPDEPVSDFDQEEEIFVSAIISKYMESKSKRKSSNIGVDSFYWALSPETAKTHRKGGDEEEEFFSAGSRLSRCSSAKSFDEAFVSAKTCFSRCSSLSRIDVQDFGNRRSIILELIHCEGWPFGLCRKALLLPPLPKSPADSWSWRKSARIVKIH